jgi:hypothetical protein
MYVLRAMRSSQWMLIISCIDIQWPRLSSSLFVHAKAWNYMFITTAATCIECFKVLQRVFRTLLNSCRWVPLQIHVYTCAACSQPTIGVQPAGAIRSNDTHHLDRAWLIINLEHIFSDSYSELDSTYKYSHCRELEMHMQATQQHKGPYWPGMHFSCSAHYEENGQL